MTGPRWLPLETGRLHIRAFRPRDAGPLAGFYEDIEATRYLGGVRTPEAVAQRVDEILARQASTGWGPAAVERRGDGRLVGYCGLQPLPGTDDIELLYGLLPDCWGRGYATEMAGVVLRAGLEVLALPRVVAVVHPDNRASIAVLRRIGMKYDGDTIYEPLGFEVERYVATLADVQPV